jgi:hypothetical protein
MDIGEMMRLAKSAGNPEYLEAELLYNNVGLELETLAKVHNVAHQRSSALSNRMEAAAESYYKTLEDEISVAPACKCKCEGEQ